MCMCEQEWVGGDLSGDGVGHSSGGLVMPPSYLSLTHILFFFFFLTFTGVDEVVVESRGTHTHRQPYS